MGARGIATAAHRSRSEFPVESSKPRPSLTSSRRFVVSMLRAQVASSPFARTRNARSVFSDLRNRLRTRPTPVFFSISLLKNKDSSSVRASARWPDVFASSSERTTRSTVSKPVTLRRLPMVACRYLFSGGACRGLRAGRFLRVTNLTPTRVRTGIIGALDSTKILGCAQQTPVHVASAPNRVKPSQSTLVRHRGPGR